ncbi:DUF3124 domain-containing protein [Mesoflavibacter profundi]|uniref:DUF3124 domain-containing protein n=1 Tax=Mesoflavibacter profundi TaxID=2708110 RepID=A0ABT4RYF2_9FLAO|nr:DUF3124 domain-containing protein [Mesoflavibacter profundi]MDA0176846.1 DUF3124 domain-containing protein [Mesoflavibacter profundi]
MKNILVLLAIVSLCACQSKQANEPKPSSNLQSMVFNGTVSDSLKTGHTYLSVYSQIYSTTEHKTHDLTATVSIRNVSTTDTIYIKKADYYNTKGDLIRHYIKQTIFVKPMQTIEIVIDEKDKEGGTGANFMFEWQVDNQTSQPYFEAVMISTSGQQGLSFTTKGVDL